MASLFDFTKKPSAPSALRGGSLLNYATSGPRTPGKSAPGRFQSAAEAIGKGLLRSVGYVKPYDPEESQTLGRASEIVGNIAQFVPLLRGAGIVTRGLGLAGRAAAGARAAGAIRAGRALPLLEFPVRSAIASGAQEAIKQGVGAFTRRETPSPASVAYQALWGGALPLAFAAPGAIVRKGLEAIPALRQARVGSLVGRVTGPTARAAGGVVGRVSPSLGKVVSGIPRTTSAVFQTPERRAAIMGVRGLNVRTILDAAERGGGLTSPTGARTLGGVLYRFAQGLVPSGHKRAANLLGRAANHLRRQLTPVAAGATPAGRVFTFGGQPFTLGPRTSGVSQQWIRKTADLIGDALSEPYFRKNVAEKEFLASIKDLMLLELKTGPRVVEGHLRGFLTHYYLGLLNVGSALVNITGLYTNVVTKYGLENTMWAVSQWFDRSPLAKFAAQRVIGKGFGQMAAGGGIISSRNLLKASTSLFSFGERFMRPVAAMAAYRQAILQGAAEPTARRIMQQAARTALFDYQWNMPRLLRSAAPMGSAMRVMFQFYNFPMHQVNFAAGLNIPQFVQFVMNTVAAGGALAVPGLRTVTDVAASALPESLAEKIDPRVADRTPYLMIGVSLLERLVADPETQPIVEGPLAQLTGVSLGRRVDWSEDYVKRLVSWEDGPFQEWAKNIYDSLSAYMVDPTQQNLIELARTAVLPLAGQRLGQAMEAERTGEFTTRTGLPVPATAGVTPDETGRAALGLAPLRLARGRALMGVQRGLERARQVQTSDPRRMLRHAVLAGDEEGMQVAIERLVEMGYTISDIRRLIREVGRPADERLVRETPTQLRPTLLPLIRKQRP